MADRDEAVLDLARRAAGGPCSCGDGVARVGARDALPASPSSVAEKKSVWRSAGTWATMRSTAGRKPMSSMRSASSRTSTCTCSSVRRRGRSGPRAGRAWRRGCASAAASLVWRANAGAAVDGGRCESARACATSSKLVDDLGRRARASARGRAPPGAALGVGEPVDDRQAEGERLARAGRRLDEHVAAGKHVGDDEALDGEGLGDAAAASASTTGRDTPRSAKDETDMRLLTRPRRGRSRRLREIH